MVISYKVPWLTGQIMRRQALAEATLKQLRDEANRRTLTEIFTEMHHVLKQNTAQRAAEVVASVVEKRRARP